MSSAQPETHCIPLEENFYWLGERMKHPEVVAILRLDDFPAEAQAERRYYERAGCVSCIFVPLVSEHCGVGAIALESTRPIDRWPDELTQLGRLAGQTIASGLRCIEHRRCVFRQLDLERIVAGIGADMANSPDCELVGGVRKGLAALGEFAGADGCALIPFSSHSEGTPEGLWWISSRVDPRPSVIPDPSRSEMLQRIRSGRYLRFGRIDELDPSWTYDRQLLSRTGVKSGLAVPVFVETEFFGVMGICSFSVERCWPETWAPRLMLVGQMFANGLIRAKKNEELEKLKQQLQAENAYLRKEIRGTHRHEKIVGESPSLRRVLSRVEAAAPTNSTILILGETGTGKELIADAIHELSPRKSRPMITVNCAAIPAALAEAELFGRTAGAYTGADTSEGGRFEVAHGSTIFFDEIGELPLGVQAKLLRVLQDGQFQRVGGAETRQVDVRVIAATNRDLEEEVRRGRFRKDLYHRLNVIPIHVPPLRDRLADIPLLVRAFVDEVGRRMGRSIERIPQPVIDSLQRYSWPGNVRELMHVVERAMVLAQGNVLQIELPTEGRPLVGSDMTLQQVERAHIQRVLDGTQGRVEGKGGAAEVLGLKPSTLRSRLAKLGVRRDVGSHDNS
jgi:transcriptional regulator with GAF, ATPase, and Fis domain